MLQLLSTVILTTVLETVSVAFQELFCCLSPKKGCFGICLAGFTFGLGIAATLGIFLSKDASLVQMCKVYPEYIRDPQTPAKKEDEIQIRCQFQTDMYFCEFCHAETSIWCFDPSNIQFDEQCDFKSDNMISDMLRFTAGANGSECHIQILNNIAHDLGKWDFSFLEWIGGYSHKEQIIFYTSNQSVTSLHDLKGEDITFTHYQVNQSQTQHIDCVSKYGSPPPNLSWSINGITLDNNDRSPFRIWTKQKVLIYLI